MSASTYPIHRRPSPRLAPNPSRTSSPGLSRALAPLFCTLLHQSETHPVPFQSVAHSLQKHPGCHPELHFNSSTLNCSASSAATPSESTLVDVLRVLPCFGRNRPPATPVESTLTDFASVTPLSATLTKTGGGGPTMLTSRRRDAFCSPRLLKGRRSFDHHRKEAAAAVHSRRRDRLLRPVRSAPTNYPLSAVATRFLRCYSPPLGPSTSNSPRRCLP
jgi:hypothetical protein